MTTLILAVPEPEPFFLFSPRGMAYRLGPMLLRAATAAEADALGCKKCGNLVSCTCGISATHKATCRFRRAAALPFELACEHGYQACPICDPCECGIAVEGIR